jgi:hypothetical protein
VAGFTVDEAVVRETVVLPGISAVIEVTVVATGTITVVVLYGTIKIDDILTTHNLSDPVGHGVIGV